MLNFVSASSSSLPVTLSHKYKISLSKSSLLSPPIYLPHYSVSQNIILNIFNTLPIISFLFVFIMFLHPSSSLIIPNDYILLGISILISKFTISSENLENFPPVILSLNLIGFLFQEYYLSIFMFLISRRTLGFLT